MADKLPPPPVSIPATINRNNSSDDNDALVQRAKEAQPMLSQETINAIILNGDLSKLAPHEKTAYYIHRCRALGLDPATKPFDLLKLQGKEVLYANKGCAAQLRDLRKISTAIMGENMINDVLVVRVRAWYPDGRQHEDEGFAAMGGLKGDMFGNARLKAITKATRRAILHLCGLGELDETEVETIPNAKTSAFAEARAAIQIPNVPATGTDAIQVADIKGADANTDTIEVLDANGRVWLFKGKEAQDVAFKALGQSDMVMVEYTKEGSDYVVQVARV